MPKIRDYATEENARAALEKEGLLLEGVTFGPSPEDSARFIPLFSITEGAPGAEELAARLTAEGFFFSIDKPRDTFTVPDGHVAIRDAEGRATGETRPMTDEELEALTGAILDLSGVEPEARSGFVSVINPHVSDLFLNYGHGVYIAALSDGSGVATEREAIRQDAEAFRASVLGAFGIAINTDELVDDFFARVEPLASPEL